MVSKIKIAILGSIHGHKYGSCFQQLNLLMLGDQKLGGVRPSRVMLPPRKRSVTASCTRYDSRPREYPGGRQGTSFSQAYTRKILGFFNENFGKIYLFLLLEKNSNEIFFERIPIENFGFWIFPITRTFTLAIFGPFFCALKFDFFFIFYQYFLRFVFSLTKGTVMDYSSIFSG